MYIYIYDMYFYYTIIFIYLYIYSAYVEFWSHILYMYIYSNILIYIMLIKLEKHS